MAIIYSFPNLPFNELNVSDTLIINDTNSNNEITTRTVTLKNLADFVTSTGTGTGTTNAIIKWSDGPAGLLGDSIMTENATQIDLAGTFLSTSSPTATAGPVHAIRANQSTTTGGAFNIALYGDTKHTGATQANSNYGIYTKAEFEGTGGYTGIILGGTFEGRYDGSGTNGANASLYGSFSKARVTAASSGDIQYMIGSNVTSEMDSGTTTDVEFLQGQHTNVTFNSGNVSGDIAVNLLDFDYTAGTLQGDFAYLQIQNDPVPTPVTGTARAINSDSTLPSHFSGDVEIPLIPTANSHATSKQYVDQQIASIPAGLVFQGNWDASTNTPTLASGVGTVGNYYVVSVAGNTNLDGITDWEVGDWAVFVEVGGVDKWDKIDQTFVQGAGATGQVSFWNGVNSVTGDNDLYWDNANKRLGIQTSSPASKLHISGISQTGNSTVFRIENNTSNAKFLVNSISGDYNLQFKNAGNAVKVLLDSNGDSYLNGGNVGIGTTSPDSLLEISSGTTTDFLKLTSTGSLASPSKIIFEKSATEQGIVEYVRNGDLRIYNTDSDGGVLIDGSSASGNDLYVKNDGNVGIGTSSPVSKLHIDEAGTISPALFIDTVRYGASIIGDGTSNSQYLLNLQSNGGSTDVMRVQSSGNVGIGTTSPAATLDVVGRIGLNDGNNNVSVGDLAGDALTTGDSNVAMGYQALSSETQGDRNVAIGFSALQNQNFTSSTDAYNTAVGYSAGTAITTGINNTIIGGLAGDALTTGEDNTALGYNALTSAQADSRNTAIGRGALAGQNGAGTAYNTALGYNAGGAVTTGAQNTIIGGLAGDALTTGSNNVAVGRSALSAEQEGGRNTAIGYAALLRQNTTGFAYNTAIGYNTGENITTGTDNTIIGGLAGDALTTGSLNVAVGKAALGSEDTGSASVAVGHAALMNQDGTGSIYNVAVGHNAGIAVTTGIQNTIIGGLAGDSLTDANNNVAIGYLALTTETSGGNNVAIGVTALQQSNGGTYNVAIGRDSGQQVTTGEQNTFVGAQSGDAVTTGDNNVAIGYNALGSETIGNGSVAIGAFALEDQQSGAGAIILNTAVGYEAGKNIDGGPGNGDHNTAIGGKALDNETTGQENTAVGVDALGGQDGADNNTALGWRAGYTTTTGSNVTLIGYNALASTGTVSNEITLGDTNVTALRCAVTSITSLSDERDKSDIKDLTYGLELIDSLKPKEFVWDNRAEIDDEGNEFYSANKGKKDFGFIAQEVKELDDDTLRLVYDENPERLEMSYGKLVPILVKAIQELSAKVKILENK